MITKQNQNGQGERPARSHNGPILAANSADCRNSFSTAVRHECLSVQCCNRCADFRDHRIELELAWRLCRAALIRSRRLLWRGRLHLCRSFPNGGAWTLPGFLIAGIAASIVALPIGMLIFRLRGPYFALSMLAFAEILRLVAQNWTSVTMGASGFLLSPTLDSKLAHYYLALGALAVLLAITAYMAMSRPGFYFLAIREDQDVAEALGVNIVAYKMLALTVSAFFTGLAGAIYANYFAYIEPNVVFSVVEISLATYLIAVLGGMGTIFGPLIGSIVLTSVGEVLRVYTGTGNILFYEFLIVVVVLFMPDGVMGMLRSRTRRQPGTAA